jgi:hypothetical protein
LCCKLVLPLDFTWTAPDTCPTQAEVVEQLTRAVDAGGKELPPLTAQAIVAHEGNAWRLELTTEMDGRRGTRQLEADSCEGLARAATLVLALTLGEGIARRQAEEEEKKAAPPPPPPPAARDEPKAPAPPSPPTTRWQVSAGAGLGVDPVGKAVPVFAIGAAYQPSWLRLGLRLGLTLPSTSELAGSSGELQARSYVAELEACFAPALQPVRIAACAVGGVTWLQVESVGLARDDRAAIPLYGLGPSLELSWSLHEHAFLGLGVVSRFYVKRPQLVVEGAPPTRRVEAVSGAAELGGGWRW